MKTRFKWLAAAGKVVLFLAGSLAVGAFCGFVFLKTGIFDLLDPLSGVSFVLGELWMLGAFILAYFVSIALHEGGHLVCGLMSGYRFVSYRLGGILWRRGERRPRGHGGLLAGGRRGAPGPLAGAGASQPSLGTGPMASGIPLESAI